MSLVTLDHIVGSQSNMSTYTLPVELYANIAEYATKGDLLNLMLASRILYNEVERILYRAVELNIHGKNSDSCKTILRNLSSNPKRAEYVVKLHLSCAQRDPEITQTATAALRQMTKLRHLTFSPHSLLLQTLTDGCTFQLHYLEFHNSRTQDVNYLPTFFALQPQIEHLNIDYYHRDEVFPPSVLPRLRILDGPLTLMRALLRDQSRPIVKLSWVYSGGEFQKCVPFPALEVLRLSGGDDLSTFKLEVPSVAPNLRFLKLRAEILHVSNAVQISPDHLYQTIL